MRALIASLTLFAALAAAASQLGCHGDTGGTTERVAIRLLARTESGEPVPDTRIWADGRELGTTDAHGDLRTSLHGRKGARVVVTAACPAGFRTLDERREVALRGVAQSAGTGMVELQATVACEPLERLAVLVVRLQGDDVAGLPVRVGGEVVGQTDAAGLAHVLLRGRPHGTVRVELDTSKLPKAPPHLPVQSFQLGDEDSVLLFEHTLQRPRRHAGHRAVRRTDAVARERRLPYRVD